MTDESGYFRMAVNNPAPTGKPGAAASQAAAEETRTRPAPPTRGASAEVADPAGRTVLRDPVPLTFEDNRRSEFRFYPLLGKEFAEVEPEPDPNSGGSTPVTEKA